MYNSYRINYIFDISYFTVNVNVLATIPKIRGKKIIIYHISLLTCRLSCHYTKIGIKREIFSEKMKRSPDERHK
jgi:hypothetical protein